MCSKRRSSTRNSILFCSNRRVIPTPSLKRRVPLAPRNIINSPSLPVSKPALRFRIPRILHRPVLREVNMAPIEAAFPDLTGVPPEYIREHLPSSEMLNAVANVCADTPHGSTLPKELEVVVNDTVSETRPTHLLAVYSPSSPRQKVTLFPAHQLVLAAHCANFPVMPPSPSPPPPPQQQASRTTLSVVPLCLPSAETFPILHSYLHSKRIDQFRTALVPTDAAPWSTMAALGVILGVWRNSCALGIVDDDLWSAIDASWGSVVSVMTGYSS